MALKTTPQDASGFTRINPRSELELSSDSEGASAQIRVRVLNGKMGLVAINHVLDTEGEFIVDAGVTDTDIGTRLTGHCLLYTSPSPRDS